MQGLKFQLDHIRWVWKFEQIVITFTVCVSFIDCLLSLWVRWEAHKWISRLRGMMMTSRWYSKCIFRSKANRDKWFHGLLGLEYCFHAELSIKPSLNLHTITFVLGFSARSTTSSGTVFLYFNLLDQVLFVTSFCTKWSESFSTQRSRPFWRTTHCTVCTCNSFCQTVVQKLMMSSYGLPPFIHSGTSSLKVFWLMVSSEPVFLSWALHATNVAITFIVYG